MMAASVDLIKVNCTCVHCEKTHEVVLETKIFLVDGVVDHYKKPQGLKCLTCKQPHLKWSDTAKLLNNTL